MARKKVILQRIANDAIRRATFKKRRKGLMKKASELATLCGVDACVVVYGEGELQATEVWPSPAAAAGVLERFKAMPELDQYKKMTDLEGWFRQHTAKLREQVDKARRENTDRETALLLHDVISGRRSFAGLTIEQVTSLGWMVEARLKSVSDRLQQLGEQPILPTPAPLPLPVAAVLPPDHPTAGYTMGVKMEAPIHHESLLMDVGGDISSVVYGWFGGCDGSNSSAGADMMQLGNGNAGAGLAWGAGPGASSSSPHT
ncbi:hypothetical protein GUJ93_ZPchr0003g18175 [Zizania palustris]|uniref:MADS-box domain-containing protein n=1 Tax=Zizania palustris TaxID=103762 RepID=A0A8J5VJV2_ZIZPA|nr:hypothetical protein GUJ93_ZPchr0003g18175 [Zizania palustris]